MPPTDSGDGGHSTVGELDGGVSRRLVRRCRTAASILLVIGAAVMLVVVTAGWGVISASLFLVAAILVVGSVLLLRRGALWSVVAESLLPGASRDSARIAAPWGSAGFGVTGSRVVRGAGATIGPPRSLSPGVAAAPVKRRLSSALVPIYADDGRSPGDGALIVHARADGTVLTEGDRVLVWLAGSAGLTSFAAATEGAADESSIRGRFVLYRVADGEVFLATTRLTDSW